MYSLTNRHDEGKKFEEDFRRSTPPEVYIYRFRDPGKGHFGVTNPCDYLCYRYPLLYLFELKRHKGKSVPLSVIRDSQLEGMAEESKRPGVKAGLVLNFCELGETYFVGIGDVIEFVCEGKRQSVPVDWCREVGKRVDQHLVRTRYRYNVDKLLGELARGGAA